MNIKEMEEKKLKIEADSKPGDVSEQIQKIIEQQNRAMKPVNRKQRRAMEKENKKQQKRLQRYLELHPDAIKIDLDEEAIAKVEAEEKATMTSGYMSAEDAMKVSNVVGSEEDDTMIVELPFTELAEEEK
jgi:lipid II:glycine glycyltransferase (peptidoglycan interpeptide bridge formation enzyme)